MNIGVCVPLNPTGNRTPTHNGPIRYVTDEAAERGEQALALREEQNEQNDLKR